ncbi:hypothetical protein GF373_04585 [bacterium]|nr:hypothetical protein [bacterium]
MLILSNLLYGLGSIIVFVSWVTMLIIAFNDSVPWGLLSLVAPPILFIFIILHFDETKYFVVAFLVGGAILKIGQSIPIT